MKRTMCPVCWKDKPNRAHYLRHVKEGSMREVVNFTVMKVFRKDNRGQRKSYNRLTRTVDYEMTE